MLVPIKWLKKYIEIDKTPEELAVLINNNVLEIESVYHPGKEIKGVIVAQITEVAAHPNADKLHLLTVDTGQGLQQIVCGAQNVAPNKKVALAQLGGELPGGFKLKPVKIRGVESCGMCCSEKELGLAESAEGILILPDDAPLGEDFVKYYGLDDVVLDLDVLPNRGDLQSITAIAIELHASTGGVLKLPVIKKEVNITAQKKADIEINAPELCGRYMSCILDNVEIKDSPEWLQKTLQSVGLRPINNVVDITNFVLYELGQPLHAFDYDQLAGGKIIVRRAQENEKFISLDEKEYSLNKEMLVIADEQKPLALAGIMGGLNSGVSEKTKTILLESAWFNPTSIRKTSRAIALRSDASIRFEKAVSYEGVANGFYRALELFQELAGAQVVSPIVDLAPGRPQPVVIDLTTTAVNKLLGTKITETQIIEILKRLQFVVEPQEALLKVTVPSARIYDVTREADLIEEIARHIGLENIPTTLPTITLKRKKDHKKEQVLAIVHNTLRAAGLNETYAYSMTDPAIYQKIGVSEKFNNEQIIGNPLSVEESVMRQSLLPQLLLALEKNIARKVDAVKLYEIGKVYFRDKEINKVAGLIYGELESGILSKQELRSADFYYLKGVLENIFEQVGLDLKKVAASNSNFFHPGKALSAKGLLELGEVHPAIISKLGLNKKAYLFELDLDKLVQFSSFIKVQQELAVYPSSRRDIAFMIDEKYTNAQIEQHIEKTAGDIFEAVTLFDLYQGENVPAGKVSLAYYIRYRAKDRTLKDEEVNTLHDKIAKSLVEKFKIEFR